MSRSCQIGRNPLRKCVYPHNVAVPISHLGLGKNNGPQSECAVHFTCKPAPSPVPRSPPGSPLFIHPSSLSKYQLSLTPAQPSLRRPVSTLTPPPLQLYLLHKQYWSQTITGLMSKIKSMPHLSPAEGLKVQFNHRKINKTLLGGG